MRPPSNGTGRRVCARRTHPNHRDVARRLHSVVRARTCFQRTQSRARDALAWPQRCPRGSPGEGSAPEGASTHLGHATPRRERYRTRNAAAAPRKCRCVYSCFSGLEAVCERGSPAGRDAELGMDEAPHSRPRPRAISAASVDAAWARRCQRSRGSAARARRRLQLVGDEADHVALDVDGQPLDGHVVALPHVRRTGTVPSRTELVGGDHRLRVCHRSPPEAWDSIRFASSSASARCRLALATARMRRRSRGRVARYRSPRPPRQRQPPPPASS